MPSEPTTVRVTVTYDVEVPKLYDENSISPEVWAHEYMRTQTTTLPVRVRTVRINPADTTRIDPS